MYYLLQPYNINSELKNGLYKIKLIHEFTGDEIDFEHIVVGSLNKKQKEEALKILERLRG